MKELKKCPFCGSKAKVLNHYNEGTVEICCADEFGTCYIVPHTEEGFHLHEVERDWNNRPTEEDIRAKAIEDFRKMIRLKIMYEIDDCEDWLEWVGETAEQLKEREADE